MKNKFKNFQPLNDHVDIKIKDLLKRGGKLIVEKHDYIETLRYQSIARIDQHGRVEWRVYRRF